MLPPTQENLVDSMEIRILTLHNNENKDSTLYRLQKGWEIRFMLGPTLASKEVTVYCNHPTSSDERFDRKCFKPLKWSGTSKNKGDNSDDFCSICTVKAGSYQYYFLVNYKKCGSGYFVVDPTLHVGSSNTVLPLDSVCMQTILTKSLGKFKDWKQRIEVSYKTGYNVVHLTPLQELGCSNSSYSISDQLKVNPAFINDKKESLSQEDVERFVEEIRQKWNMLMVTDVVWNHTAKSSKWLKKNPECGFNLKNSPHLKPAYVLDRALLHLTLDVGKGKLLQDYNIPTRVLSTIHLESIKDYLNTHLVPSLKLWEFFQVDVDKAVVEFHDAVVNKSVTYDGIAENSAISIIQDPNFIRMGCAIDMAVAVYQFCPSFSAQDVDVASSHLKDTLVWLNSEKKKVVIADLLQAADNVISTINYERLADDGPKKKDVNKFSPLVTGYFLHDFADTSVKQEEKDYVNNPENGQYIMAFNGWVMGDDPLRNFAEYPSKTFFRRELICWGDCVKLNYRKSSSDCPALWDRMKKYTQITAKCFHGIRIDNCHSTPVHVAEYMLDAARKIRPELYVFAELFTGSEHIDNIFVNRLGINSLIREAMSAWDSHELGRMIYKYGGEPIASFTQSKIRQLSPTIAHGLLYDATHDNPSAVVKKTVHDVLPSSALVSMACCATGSNRGHDELVPHHIHVVSENRLYKSWSSSKLDSENIEAQSNVLGMVDKHIGMLEIRNILNVLHQTMAYKGFSQVFVDQRNEHVVAVTRHNPKTHQSYVLVAHTAFQEPGYHHCNLEPLKLEGKISGIALEAYPKEICEQKNLLNAFAKENQYINGLQGYKFVSETDISVGRSKCCSVVVEENAQTVYFTNFPPGSIVVFRINLHEKSAKNTREISELVSNIEANKNVDLNKIIQDMTLVDLNTVLFCCDEEEKSDGKGISVYDIPGWQKLPYCGIKGIEPILSHIRITNDLGHPVCNNIREGNWLIEYAVSRLQKHSNTEALGDWLETAVMPCKSLPRYLVPLYFERILSVLCTKLLESTWHQMDDFIKQGSMFVKNLSLASVALCSVVNEAGLPPVLQCENVEKIQWPSLAAGLPHFSSGVMRNWGRDTFIAMRGLLLIPGRVEEAKHIILSFAGCIRHGLIPNLLGEGKICRYNCRDAVWWWLQCIQDVCEMSENGHVFLNSKVGRIYPTDDSEPQLPPTKEQLLYDVIQECLQLHINGIEFTERGAGPGIDMNMSEKGFQVIAGIDIETGFVYGGSGHNCGTWMDKMGESEKAGIKGKPATPRDGSAVELIGLCKSTVSWLYRACNARKYPYDGVFLKGQQTKKFSWYEWEKKIQCNFEKSFYVSEYDQNPLVHKHGIYKDTFGATAPWCDYQLRPNFPIAMVVAPELFHVRHAWNALNIVQEKLLGPLGIKTLDPDDMAYRGDYDNGIDNDDASVSKGFNYHQGPEWLWPVGFFLRAKLHFASQIKHEDLVETANFIRGYLATHQHYLDESLWCGLPELTNSDGKWCRDSCEIQAWSNSTLIELMYDLNKYGV